jgi:hypothetical protein
MQVLKQQRFPFLVGGAYALAHYGGVVRHTKDFDIFLRPADCVRALELLSAAGFCTELTFPHWLGKAYQGDDFIDVIFSSGNGIARVDEGWFEHAVHAEVLGEAVLLCPVEEIIWSKGFVTERERFDGADICHLLRSCAPILDWRRLLARFGPHWRVLLGHLVFFGFVYPSHRDIIPDGVMQELLARLQDEMIAPPPRQRVCRGTLLSREQYLPDIEEWGYQDARLRPLGNMSAEDIQIWTDAIGQR